ncbi:hypothetical protein [Sphaerisporangium fuscum]|uniref:hypothetical protein n=1 Tax=Sphaerisporangium fuscum TaxID=2835868 RepID=UPI001BDCEA2F|nr:hypothetical protein [Sphaerisporangium fuscum]
MEPGQATAGVPAEFTGFYPWPDLTTVPIRDAAPCQWALMWRTAAESPLIRAFAQAATDVRNAAEHPE